jgi:hypothetical protein
MSTYGYARVSTIYQHLSLPHRTPARFHPPQLLD